MPFADFVIGRRYRLHEDMWPASEGFGSYYGGIQAKGRFPRTESIVVLAELEGGRYGNRWDDERLRYQGEDDKWATDPRTADQKPDKGNNKALTHQKENDIPLYLFTKTQPEKKWTYQGLASVEGVEVLNRDGRNIVEYKILPLEVASLEELTRVKAEVESGGETPPVLRNRASNLKRSARRVRSVSFSLRVKEEYGNRCAVCGRDRTDAWGRPEVQAAHIYPREEDGADDVRNGIALCTFHHWAFDGGLFFIDEALKIRVTVFGHRVPELASMDGGPLEVLPLHQRCNPHPLYINARLDLSSYLGLRSGAGLSPESAPHVSAPSD